MTLLAQLIAKQEGYGVPGALPTRSNNPGDLEHAPGEMHAPDAPNSVGSFATPEEGWEALDEQLQRYTVERPGITLRQTVYIYAPPNENDTAAYLQFVCEGLNCEPDILLSDALKLGD